MKYLDQYTQQEWDQFGENLAKIFGVVHTPTPYEPIELQNHNHKIPWNKGKKGLQPSTRKGTKQGPLSAEAKAKLVKRLAETPNPMSDPVHRAAHKAAMVNRILSPEAREKMRESAKRRWARYYAKVAT